MITFNYIVLFGTSLLVISCIAASFKSSYSKTRRLFEFSLGSTFTALIFVQSLLVPAMGCNKIKYTSSWLNFTFTRNIGTCEYSADYTSLLLALTPFVLGVLAGITNAESFYGIP